MLDPETRTIEELPATAFVLPGTMVGTQAPGGPMQSTPLSQLGQLIAATSLQDAIINLMVVGAIDILRANRAAIVTDLDHPAETVAFSYGDAVSANNDFYVKTGGSGVGAWVQTTILADAIAGVAGPFVASAENARDGSVAAQLAAQAARDIAVASADLANDFLYGGLGGFHASVPEGLALTAEGQCFFVKGTPDTIVGELYKKVGGVAVPQQRAIPSAAALKSHAELYLSLDDAVAAVGTNAVLNLKAGHTYIQKDTLRSLPGLTIRTNGATIKRCDQIITTTTSALLAGVSNSVSVVDASQFEVGMRVAFAQQGVARADLVIEVTLTNIRTILGKGGTGGNTLTFDAPVDADIAIGGTCFLAFEQVNLADGAWLVGPGTIDGNRDNWPFARWEVTNEVVTQSAGSKQGVTRIKFANVPGEAIMAYGNDQKFLFNEYDTVGGNAHHLSGVNTALILGSNGVNGNIDTAVGHGDGFVSFSNGNSNVTVTKNKAREFIAGIGAINETDSHITSEDNDWDDMYCHGVQGDGDTSNVVVKGDRIKNVGTNPAKKPGLPYYGGVCLSGLTGVNYTVTGIEVTVADPSIFSLAISSVGGKTFHLMNNPLLAGKVEIAGLDDFELGHNKIDRQLIYAGLKNGKSHHNRVNAPLSGVTYAMRTMSGYVYENVDIEDNIVNGGLIGGYIDPDATHYRSIRYNRNKFNNQVLKGLHIPPFTNAADCRDVEVQGNSAPVGAAAADEFFAFHLEANDVDYDVNRSSNYQGAGARTAFLIGSSMNKAILRSSTARGAWQHRILLTENSGVHVLGSVLEGGDITYPTGNNIAGTVLL